MNTEQAEIQVRHAKHVREQWCRSLARHTDKDFRFWSTKTKKGTDTFFSADEALEWGVADKIWDQKEGE
jgi:ATP-dependent protease ClpP protease subunit